MMIPARMTPMISNVPPQNVMDVCGAQRVPRLAIDAAPSTT
jgi:hypothetical protein